MGDVPQVAWMWACLPPIRLSVWPALGQEPSPPASPIRRCLGSAESSPEDRSSPAALHSGIGLPPAASGPESILSTSVHQQTALSAPPALEIFSSGPCLGAQGFGEWSGHHTPVLPSVSFLSVSIAKPSPVLLIILVIVSVTRRSLGARSVLSSYKAQLPFSIHSHPRGRSKYPY